MKKRKGFTLIELLAVIVILGLLMAIAIPSITKYITQSRKKTITTTIGNYIGALINQVNDMEYTFTATNTVYAVPIECVSLERGGKSPFGEWHQSNDKYWAYVLVQYDDISSSYIYGFTFKDSAGYGLYPTSNEKLNESGKQIKTELNLTRPTTGQITNITSNENWNGFDIDDNTDLIVLEAESEGNVGNGKTTCTLCQKGSNYEVIEQEKDIRLVSLIKKYNPIKNTKLTITKASSSSDSGMYSSTSTNSGGTTYFFRGYVYNNYVKFADQIWRIVRINEDGTVKLITQNGINGNAYYAFNSNHSNYLYTYYSNSNIKPIVEDWYTKNISEKGYDSYVSTESFCEQAKVKFIEEWTNGSASMVHFRNYEPNFKCSTDGNGKGIINSKVGLISIDEVLYAGGYPYSTSHFYLKNDEYFWTMSSAGVGSPFGPSAWYVYGNGYVYSYTTDKTNSLRPVINLNADVIATGTGTSDDPYIVQTK